MSDVQQSTDHRQLRIEWLTFSSTNAQTERRKHFDKTSIAELAASIKSVGLVQPILVRPSNTPGRDRYEVVAGERRALAAKQAGLETIDATVRSLTDEQVLELQLVENLQREDLHELVEAEGYESLQKMGYSIDDIATKVGKSKGTVYARMKLLALDPASRGAFFDGKISSSIALLIARIPVATVQRQACIEIVSPRHRDGPMSYRDAREHIERNYMLRLADAPFPTGDAQLLPKAGACGACPKRTGNQPELFADIKGADVCTDPVCFKLKREAWAKVQVAEAKAAGRKVIEGKAAKDIFPYHGSNSAQGGYVALDGSEYLNGEYRKVRSVVGKSVTPTLVKHPTSGDFVEVITTQELKAACKNKGVKTEETSTRGNPQQGAREKKAKRERMFRAALLEQMREKLPTKLTVDVLRVIATGYIDEMQHDSRKHLCKLYAIEPVKSKYTTDFDGPLKAAVAKMDEGAVAVFLQTCYYASDVQTSTWSDAPASRLLAGAKSLKIDPGKIRKGLEAAAAAKAPAKPKAAKKK